MICGSCLHDNALAKALIRRGVDVQLIPTYTPIRTDEESISDTRVFLGGLNLYLSQTVPGWRFLPRAATRWLDHPALIRWATSKASSTSAQSLGALTLSMLRGSDGFQRREVDELCQWLSSDLRPELVVLSNVLIAGFVPRLKRTLPAKVLVTLQGDDIFLDSLPEPYKSRSLDEITRLVQHIDGFLTNSRFYADYMSSYLGIPRDKIQIVPLGIDVSDFPADLGASSRPNDRPASQLAIGYLARLAPEKGLHVLVDAFIELRRRSELQPQLYVAGWMGEHQRAFVDQQRAKLRSAGLEHEVHWKGEVDRRTKIEFLQELDLFSVPATYAEPKGLYVLEALAAGVPVVEPNHGAFPEMLEATGGGVLVPPNDSQALAETFSRLLKDEPARRKLAREGHSAVHARYNAQAMAEATWSVIQRYLSD